MAFNENAVYFSKQITVTLLFLDERTTIIFSFFTCLYVSKNLITLINVYKLVHKASNHCTAL